MFVYVSDQQLAERYSVSRATIWRWVAKGLLPKPCRLSEGCTRWSLQEVEAIEAKRFNVKQKKRSPMSSHVPRD